MKHLNLNLIGRFGNTCIQYLFARGFCEQHGFQLATTPWIGQKIFDLPEHPVADLTTPRRTETQLLDNPEGNVSVEGYFQNQRSIDYWSRSKAKEWLKIKWPLFKGIVDNYMPKEVYIAYHLRRGDFSDCGYPLIAESSYKREIEKLCAPKMPVIRCSDDTPQEPSGALAEFPFLKDFYLLMLADHLYRANSTFSWFAHVLADDSQRVFSPVIDNAVGGVENDVPWVEGNHPRLANFDFTTELRLRP